MKIEKDQEIICGINVIETVLILRPGSAKTLFVLDSKSNSRIKKVLSSAKTNQIEISLKTKDFFSNYFGDQNHQGLAMLCNKRIEEPESFLDILLERDSLFLLILDHITDPHNVGACLRSAAAANVDAVIVPKNRSCHLTPTVRKVSSGGSELVPFVVVTNLVRTIKKMKLSNVNIVGAESTGGTNYKELVLEKKNALIIGSEDKGLKKLTAENCDTLIRVDLPGSVDSLNASVACGILLFEFVSKSENFI